MTLTQDDIINTTTPVQDGHFRITKTGTVYKQRHYAPYVWYPCAVTLLDRGGSNYLYVSKMIGDKQVRFGLHRLIAEAFIQNDDPDNNTHVLAKDGDLTNIDVDNLYWATKTDAAHYRAEIKRAQFKDKSRPCGLCGKIEYSFYDFKLCHKCYTKKKRRDARAVKYRKQFSAIDRSTLSKRDLAFLDLRLNGDMYPEIAEHFGVKLGTVQYVFAKLTKLKQKD